MWRAGDRSCSGAELHSRCLLHAVPSSTALAFVSACLSPSNSTSKIIRASCLPGLCLVWYFCPWPKVLQKIGICALSSDLSQKCLVLSLPACAWPRSRCCLCLRTPEVCGKGCQGNPSSPENPFAAFCACWTHGRKVLANTAGARRRLHVSMTEQMFKKDLKGREVSPKNVQIPKLAGQINSAGRGWQRQSLISACRTGDAGL